ncbi:MAG: hypothetical protein V4635_13860 [Bacteroidota bacterium]
MTIQDFARTNFFDQVSLIKNEATLIDTYLEAGNIVMVYSLNGFFIEATINPITEDIIEIIPFKRGFLSNKKYLHDHLRTHILSYVLVA